MGAPLCGRRSRLRLEQLSRAKWEADRERHFWRAYEDALRHGGYPREYDLEVVDVGEYDD